MSSTGRQEHTLAFVPDLMDWSKLSSIMGLSRIKSLELSVIEGATKLIVDLDKVDFAELSTALASGNIGAAQLVGFCSHVNTELRSKAEELGFLVLARSRFFANPASFV